MKTLNEMIDELIQLQKMLYPDFPPEVMPPALDVEILAAEGLLGHPLPKSYKSLLKIYNGWDNFGVMKLFGTKDFGSPWANKQIEYYKDVDAGAPFQNNAIPFLMGEAGDVHHFWAFDPNSTDPNGEMEIVNWDHGIELIRLSNFIAFVDHELNLQRTRANR